MNRKSPEPDDVESSSEEEEDEAEEDDESGAESSSEEDGFDSEDDRVNIIPGQDTERIPSEAPKASAEDESSSESDEEDDTMEADTKKPIDPSHPQKVQTFDSDVESEYETESSSETESLTQEPDVVEGTPTNAMEAPPPSQKKLQETQVLESKAASEEGAQQGTSKAAKQQEKDPPPLRSAKGEALKNVQEESQSARNVIKDIASDDSVRDDKKSGASAKKRKNGSSQQDAERDSADSEPISKKRKDADMAQDGKKSAAKDKVSLIPSDSRFGDLSSPKKSVSRDKPLHTLGDVAKEIAKKTLNGNNASARANGLKDVFDSKKSPAGNEIKQEKKSNRHRSSTSKQKKLPHVWSVEEEIIMASEVLNRVKMGLEVPSKRADDFWFTLSEVLQEKLGVEFSREQLSEKARRMKQKYHGTVHKIEDLRDTKKPFKHKNDSEQRLFDILSQIWGRAEVTSLEDWRGVYNGTSKSIQSPDREVKGTRVSSPKAMPLTKANDGQIESANTGKIEAAATTDNDVKRKANAVAATSTKPDHEEEQALKEDQARNIVHSPADISPSFMNKLLQERIDATLHELQEWSKRNVEDWMSKAYALIEDSTKRLEDQMRQRTSWMGMAAWGGLPMRFPLVEGDKNYQQQLHDLQLQELNVQVQRLELMRRECELKKEQIKAQLHQEETEQM
ncbi:hypothetical protein GOP47_0022895 [Adiantum capillus-veneris]|uniref:Glabrous enhancer-binding protein-like DBD domain-containing protein n=1 Tax=Adiantum capillus-veneris TaxID=13818 RepID=A0A9D4U8K9_ADICA|nr:hypothetical protein GOP47_0022895 [Adiantum capillus-veneris]